MRGLMSDFLEGRPLGSLSCVAPAVLRSWERTRSAGLMPHDRAVLSPAVTRVGLRRMQESHHDLIRCAMADMKRLQRSFGSQDRVVLLTDASGTVTISLGNETSARPELSNLCVGRNLREEELGTNAPACVLADGIAMAMAGSEHYLVDLQNCICAAAPVLGPTGELVGVLNVTALQAQWEPSVLERVVTAARCIENRLLGELENVSLLHVHSDARLLGTPMGGRLAITSSGDVVAANSVAYGLLNLAKGPVKGLNLNSLIPAFGDSLIAQFRSAAGLPRRVHFHTGSPLYVAWARPHGKFETVVSPAPSRPATLGTARLDRDLDTDLRRAVRVAKQNVAVLLQGETGVGKEVFAKAVHRQCRPDRPFVVINCAALPEGLIESELFGYVDGAFTGSRKGGSVGRLAQAHTGTLLLDEIGDMSLHLQARLLRVLQEREVVPIGGGRTVALDLIVLSATHRDLQARIAEGAFREDLYYRLAGFTVQIPPLRNRSDFHILVDELLAQIDPDARLSEEVLQAFRSYLWPGNVRQLYQTLKTACALKEAASPLITLDDLPQGLFPVSKVSTSNKESSATLLDLERMAIEKALRRNGGNVSAAARELGVSRTTLYAHRKNGLCKEPQSN